MVSVAFSSPNDALGIQTMPWNFTYLFQLCIKTFFHTWNAPSVCALMFAKMAEIACKTRHFVSAKQFNVWHTQQVGSAQFFSKKLSGWHMGPIRVNQNNQKWNWGHLKKSHFYRQFPLPNSSSSKIIGTFVILFPCIMFSSNLIGPNNLSMRL